MVGLGVCVCVRACIGNANRIERIYVPFNILYTLEHSELWEGQKDVQWVRTKINGHTFLCRNNKFQLSCLINSESILHWIKQWPLKQYYMNTLYWQELKDWFMIMVNLYTLPLSFSSQLQDICILCLPCFWLPIYTNTRHKWYSYSRNYWLLYV
jgi:hypothetical protein